MVLVILQFMHFKNNEMISIFIPLRKGSKRIKNKNLRSLPGFKRGLTELKITQLSKLRKIFLKYFKKKQIEFVVSTNCKKIKNFLSEFRWVRVYERNENLATDDSLDKLIIHVPDICRGKYILWTHVTSPLFNEIDYINFIKTFFQNKNKSCKSAFSADKIQKFIFNKTKKWVSHNYKKKKWPRTQDLPEFFSVNSAAFIASREVYLKKKDRLCNNPLPIVSRSGSGFDIDDIKDFNILKKNENLIRK